MLYDFDKVYDRRSTLSSKWFVEEVFGHDDVVPLWVADMDFPVAEPIVKAIRERADHPIFGYTRAVSYTHLDVYKRQQLVSVS